MTNDRLRNIGIIAHVDAGKTTVTERILFISGKSHKMGDVHHGTSITDCSPEERLHGITISSAATSVSWLDHRITIIDTPGHVDFNIEVNRALRVLDGAVVVFDGVAGVEPQTEVNWRLADKYQVPRIAFVNKLDRMGADMLRVTKMMKDRLGVEPLVTQLPIGEGEDFVGVLDLIEMQALLWREAGVHFVHEAIPEDLRETARHYRRALVERAVEQDEAVLTRYLEGEEPDAETLRRCLRVGTLNAVFVPVLCGSAYRNKGVQPLLDAVVAYLPAPSDLAAVKGRVPGGEERVLREPRLDEPFSALAFKVVTDNFGVLTFIRAYSGQLRSGATVLNAVTGARERIGRIYEMHADQRIARDAISAGDIVALVGMKCVRTGDTLCDPDRPVVLERMEIPEPVIEVTLEPREQADQERLLSALQAIVREDPSLHLGTSAETGQMLLSGMGELHLQMVLERMSRQHGIDARTGAPQVAYKETIRRAQEQRYRLRKQTSGPGMYAEVLIRLEPLERGAGVVFENRVTGGAVPKDFIPGVESGIRSAALSGVVGGYACVDFKAVLLDGGFHEVDSSVKAFEIAAGQAFREAMAQADPVLLEPLMQVEVVTPDAYVGECIGDLNRRRGTILGQDRRGESVLIEAQVPLAEMFGYIGRLRAMSSGRASFSMHFARYEGVPPALQKTLSGT